MTTGPTQLDSIGNVAVLTLSRPEVRNALTEPGMVTDIIEALARPPTGTTVLVITGAGSAFSAGGNVREMAEKDGMFAGSPGQVGENYRTVIQQLTRAMLSTDLVTIAAVNGPAVGAGFDLALGCDLRLGAPQAWFAHTFVDLGIVPGDGGAWLLPRIVGWQRATEITLTARRVFADEALEMDVLLEVVDHVPVLERAVELASEIATRPAHSLRYTKRLLRHARTMELDGFLDLTAAVAGLSHAEPGHQRAVDDYLEAWNRRKSSNR